MNDAVYIMEKALIEYRKAERLANAIKSPEYALKFENRKQAVANAAILIINAENERNAR